jgi:hypothetical protein
MVEVKEVWFGKRNLNDVVIKLVEMNHDSDAESDDSRGKKVADCACGRLKKRGLDSDGDRNITVLAMLHVHVSNLRSSGSKYFETYFSERWNPDHSQRQPMELTLETQVSVGHYEDCFSIMYEWTSTKFEGVTHCVGVLKVTVQLLYEPVIEDGVRYLSTVQWLIFEFELVRKLVVGPDGGFPLDSANEVLARLEVTHTPVSDDNKHEGSSNEVWELPETTLKQVLVDALEYTLDQTLTDKRKLSFAKTSKQLITRPSPDALTKFTLDLINVELKAASMNLVQCGQAYIQGGAYHPTKLEGVVKNFDWLLNILLQNKVAKEAVDPMIHQDNDDFMTLLHYIFNHFFPPNPCAFGGQTMLIYVWALALQQLVETFCSIFVEVAQGQIFLIAHSRFTLIQELSWLMLHLRDKGSARWTSTKASITELIGSLPLLNQVSLFQNLHIHHEFQIILDEAYDNWCNRDMREHDAEN